MRKIGIFLIIGLVALSGYLLSSNASLKASVAEIEKRLEEPVKADNNEAVEVAEVAEPETTSTNQDVPAPGEFMNEDELLEKFFATTPTLLTGEQVAAAARGEVDQSGPILEVTPEVVDLGTISKQAGTVTAKFMLKNTGGSALTVNYAFTSCGCTVTPLKEAVVLEPGESYPMDVVYDPNFYGPNYELGATEKTITILSNYAARAFYKVQLKAVVTP